jgi:hypothetical protein
MSCWDAASLSDAASWSFAVKFKALSATKCFTVQCAWASRATAYHLAPFTQADCTSRSARHTANWSFTIFRTVQTRTWCATFSTTFSVLRLLTPTPFGKFLLIKAPFSWVFVRGSPLLIFQYFSATFRLLRRKCVTWVFEFLLLFQWLRWLPPLWGFKVTA